MKEDIFYILIITSIFTALLFIGLSEKNIISVELPGKMGIAIDSTIQIEKIKTIRPKVTK